MKSFVPLCPVDSSHGRVLDMPGERYGWYCPHVEHEGRPATHPLGPTPRTRAFFTTAEIEAGVVVDGAAA